MKIIVAGGGIGGIAASLMLADDGHDVTVLERDSEPPPPDPDAAFEWARKGVAQFTLGHWLHPRGTRILQQSMPRAYELLEQNGGLHYNWVKQLLELQPGSEVEPEDDRFDHLTGRRGALEWALATAADEHPGVTVRRGDAIAGLHVDWDNSNGVPQVDGVRLDADTEIVGDLVVDATGRRSPTPAWLADIGASAPAEVAEDSGFAYYGRYYRSADGTTPAMMAPLLSPYGSFSILSLPADNGTWSLIVYGLSDDKALRRVRDEDVFNRVVSSCPLHAHWLEGEPISDIESMAGVVDRHREFVVDGEPCATGILTMGDASSCTNPSLGRGMTFAFMHAEVLRECINDHGSDPGDLSLAFHERTEAEIRPWHDATTAIDRRRVEEMRVFRDGGTPEPTPEEQIADVLRAATTTDPIAARAFGDIACCNALVPEVFARPGVFEHILGLADQVSLDPLPGPDRDQLMELLS